MAPLPPIDLYSDTASRPTPSMLQAMCAAALGDEQRGTDPTVQALEARVAVLLGKERAVLFPSATMANQVAVAIQCQAGDEVLCHTTAHVFNAEGGGLAANARVQVRPLMGDRGTFSADTLRAALRDRNDAHHPESRLVVIENTSNGGGGTVWHDEDFDAVVRIARDQGLRIHLDGARLFNAAAARRVPVRRWSEHADTVQLCFSKGLGCGFGAVLAVSAQDERAVRRAKQRMGGSLRQAGLVAGAMLYALDHHVERLSEDHERARRFAQGLRDLGLEAPPPETNLVYFRSPKLTAADLKRRFETAGILVSGGAGPSLRACFYLGIDTSLVDEALHRLSKTL